MRSTSHRLLVAGIGNIFMGDDAFGGEVVCGLQRAYAIPDDLRVEDFGIRGYDLAYALEKGHEAVFLVDAVARGDKPGTLCLLELDSERPPASAPTTADAHSLDPVAVLQLLRTLGGPSRPGKLFLVGCQPSTMTPDNSHLGLSPAVAAAVPAAIEMLRRHLESAFGCRLKERGSPDAPGTFTRTTQPDNVRS